MTQIGHNRPPAVDRTGPTATRLLARRDKLIEAYGRWPGKVDSYGEESKATNFTKLLKDFLRECESVRKREKEPHLAASQAVDGFWGRELQSAVKGYVTEIERELTSWKQIAAARERAEREALAKAEAEERERARQEAEEARRVAAEAEAREREAAALLAEAEAAMSEATAISASEDAERAKEEADRARVDAEEAEARKRQAEHDARAARRAADKPDYDMSRLRTDRAVSSTRTRWKCTAFDLSELDLNALRDHLDDACIEKALNRYVAAGGRELAGATIEQVVTTVVR